MTRDIGTQFQESPSPVEFSFIELALDELGMVLTKKNSDYKVTSGEFSNFSFASDVSGVSSQDIMLAQIGIKIGRIRGLLNGLSEETNFESLEDSIKDLAGYAVILYAYRKWILNG